MKKILEDYYKIFQLYPADVPLNKKTKKEKHHYLMKWQNTEYEDMPEYIETLKFMREYNIPYAVPFLRKVLIPSLAEDVINKKYDNLKLFFELIDEGFFNAVSDMVILLEQEMDFKVSSFQLADFVLGAYPEHLPTIRQKYKWLDRILGFSVHEVPHGVLAGMNGADLRALEALNNDLREFERLSVKLIYC